MLKIYRDDILRIVDRTWRILRDGARACDHGKHIRMPRRPWKSDTEAFRMLEWVTEDNQQLQSLLVVTTAWANELEKKTADKDEALTVAVAKLHVMAGKLARELRSLGNDKRQ